MDIRNTLDDRTVHISGNSFIISTVTGNYRLIEVLSGTPKIEKVRTQAEKDKERREGIITGATRIMGFGTTSWNEILNNAMMEYAEYIRQEGNK